MGGYSEIENAMYNSEDFSRKGYSAVLQDPFILEENGGAAEQSGGVYVVFVVRNSGLDGASPSYTYALYSVNRQCAVSSAQEEYQHVVETLPSLTGLTHEGGNLGFFDQRRLNAEVSEIIDDLVASGSLTPDTRERYVTYLNERAELESASFRALYSSFAERS